MVVRIYVCKDFCCSCLSVCMVISCDLCCKFGVLSIFCCLCIAVNVCRMLRCLSRYIFSLCGYKVFVIACLTFFLCLQFARCNVLLSCNVLQNMLVL